MIKKIYIQIILLIIASLISYATIYIQGEPYSTGAHNPILVNGGWPFQFGTKIDAFAGPFAVGETAESYHTFNIQHYLANVLFFFIFINEVFFNISIQRNNFLKKKQKI